MKTFHRKMWEAKEQGYISEEVWKKLCNQPLKAFNPPYLGLSFDYSNHSVVYTLNNAIGWDETNEGGDYWYNVFHKLVKEAGHEW